MSHVRICQPQILRTECQKVIDRYSCKCSGNKKRGRSVGKIGCGRTKDMMEIGKIQKLKVIKEKDFGIYLSDGDKADARVFFSQKQVPEGTKIGDELEVFLYKDSEDRLIATTSRPKVTLGETAVLEVKEVSKIGAFLDMGLEKDLLLPFKEQTHQVRKGRNAWLPSMSIRANVSRRP